MGFFLVGRTSGGDLALISPEVFGSRQEALAALTTISADPAFAHRDSEVFVGNLDQATPIVLMAPAAAPAVEEPSGEDAQEPDEIAEESPEEVPEDLDHEPSALDEQPPIDAGVWEAPEVEVEPEAEVEAEQGEDLAGALKRAAGALESEGIVAPDSIGPEPAVSETTPTAETAWPWDSAPVAEPEIVAAAALEPELESESDFVEEPIAAPADELAESPADEPAEEPADEPAEEPADELAETPAEEPAEEPADELAETPAEEPAEEPAAEVAAYVPDPFEEPSVDGGDIVQLRADDETVALGRPVVMGAYSESTFEAVVEPASVAGPGEAQESAEAAIESPVEDSDADSDSLDGILADLEPIEPVPAGFAGSDAGEALTCADCVYEQTCPNKEGLDPSQCGNFQWKAR